MCCTDETYLILGRMMRTHTSTRLANMPRCIGRKCVGGCIRSRRFGALVVRAATNATISNVVVADGAVDGAAAYAISLYAQHSKRNTAFGAIRTCRCAGSLWSCNVRPWRSSLRNCPNWTYTDIPLRLVGQFVCIVVNSEAEACASRNCTIYGSVWMRPVLPWYHPVRRP